MHQADDAAALRIDRVGTVAVVDFRHMVEKYWQELMPKAEAIASLERRDAYFRAEFVWDHGNRHPYWAIAGNRRIGFMTFEISPSEKRGCITNFYVVPEERRRRYGTAMVSWLLSHLDSLGVEQIDLNVRRDNPVGFAFWKAQGFGVAGYRLRQYRDPKSGTAFIGALSSDF